LQRATPIISGFLLGYIAVLPLIGRLSDLVSRQKILFFCLCLFVLGSAVTAVSVELPVLVFGRVLQGIGGGGLVPQHLRWSPTFGRLLGVGPPLGVVGAVQELGSVLGPLLGAAVLAVADWRANLLAERGSGHGDCRRPDTDRRSAGSPTPTLAADGSRTADAGCRHAHLDRAGGTGK